MIEVEKSLWSYLKCWMGLLMLILSLLKLKSKLSGREQFVPSSALIVSGGCSFCALWLWIDQNSSGLTALEGQVKSTNGRGKLEDVKDSPVPIVRIDEDIFILVDDVLLLLERAIWNPCLQRMITE